MLIIDEMVTWGRMYGGSGIAHLGIDADLWVGAKALGGGLPLTAVVGRRQLMERFAADVFHSATFSGEVLSLAAAAAMLDLVELRDVPRIIGGFGQEVMAIAPERFRPGYPQRLTFDIDRAGLGVLLAHGVLAGGGYLNISTEMAEDAEARATLLSAFRAVLAP